jgi:alginate O-acetyltransferase complex protein AlgI
VKKFVVAEVVIRGLYGAYGDIDAVLAGLDGLGPPAAWRFVVVTFLLTYMDFSAYSDIAIGSSRLFGIRILENFDWPILATNIAAFWKRWHMTLAGWFRTYVYTPVVGAARRSVVAVYVMFIAMGLWHAGTLSWLLWGVYQATGVSIYLLWAHLRRTRGWLRRPPRLLAPLGVLLTLAFFSGSFAFTVGHGRAGVWTSLRILAALFGIQLS